MTPIGRIYVEYPVINLTATGRNIRALRMARHYTVGDICKYMGGISEQAVYKWERGNAIPSIDNLLALSKLFQVHMEDILVEENVENTMDKMCS